MESTDNNFEVFNDVFGNRVIYDLTTVNADVQELVDNLKAGTWTLLLVTMKNDEIICYTN